MSAVRPFTPATPTEDDFFAHLKDKGGRLRTRSLFMEHRHPDYPALFTLQNYNVEKGGKEYISMYKKYMEIADPTEYKVAKQLLGSWAHWLLLQEAMWFKAYLKRWRAELKVQMQSEVYDRMNKVSQTVPGTGAAIAADKWLHSIYGPTEKPKRGRPSKDERATNLKEQVKEDALLKEEMERLGL